MMRPPGPLPLPLRDPRAAALALLLAAAALIALAEGTGGGPGIPWGAVLLRLASEMLMPALGLGLALGLGGAAESAAGLAALAAGGAAGLAGRHAFLELVARLPNAASHAFLAGPIAGLAVGLLLLLPRRWRPVLLVPAAFTVGAMLAVAVKLLDPSLRDPHVPWLAGTLAAALILALATMTGLLRHPARFTAARILGSWVLAVAFLYGGAAVATRGRAAIPPIQPRTAPADPTLFPDFGHAPTP